jgi:hypothetical protein
LDGGWYNFSSRNYQFYAYSAYLDDRPSLLSNPVIRIIGCASFHEDVIKKYGPLTLQCRLYYEGSNKVRIVPMDKQHKPTSFFGEFPTETAREYIYTCGIDDLSYGLPIAVAVLRSPNEDTSNHEYVKSCMPIEVPAKPKTVRDFATCVPVSYNKLRPDRLIEWLEMQKLLGVSLVGIRCLNVTEPALKVFREYAREGFVDLRYSAVMHHYPPGGFPWDYLHSTPAINDCMYRHMYSFKYMNIIDLDEMIVPKPFLTLQELVSFLERNMTDQPSTYVFRNNLFYIDIPNNDSYVEDEKYNSYNLTLIKHRMQAQLSPPGHGAKSIINPQACVYMHNHYCWGVTKGFKSRPTSRQVDPSIATNRHYKRCPSNVAKCAEARKTVSYDSLMVKYADALKKNVDKKMATTFKNLVIE